MCHRVEKKWSYFCFLMNSTGPDGVEIFHGQAKVENN